MRVAYDHVGGMRTREHPTNNQEVKKTLHACRFKTDDSRVKKKKREKGQSFRRGGGELRGAESCIKHIHSVVIEKKEKK